MKSGRKRDYFATVVEVVRSWGRVKNTPVIRTCTLLALITGCQAPAVERSTDADRASQLLHAPIRNRLQIGFGDLQALQIDPSFTYAGGDRFILGGSADAEQHLFVIADSSRMVRRLLWIQLEQFLPSDTSTYNYEPDPVVTIQGVPFFANVRTYSSPPEPLSDRGKAFALLNSAGYRVPEGATRLRLVYLPEQRARREVMIIYAEANAPTSPASTDSLLARAGRVLTLYRK